MRLKYESVCRFVSERSIPQRADEFQSLLAQVTVRPVNPTRFRKFRTLFVDASRDRIGRFAQRFVTGALRRTDRSGEDLLFGRLALDFPFESFHQLRLRFRNFIHRVDRIGRVASVDDLADLPLGESERDVGAFRDQESADVPVGTVSVLHVVVGLAVSVHIGFEDLPIVEVGFDHFAFHLVEMRRIDPRAHQRFPSEHRFFDGLVFREDIDRLGRDLVFPVPQHRIGVHVDRRVDREPHDRVTHGLEIRAVDAHVVISADDPYQRIRRIDDCRRIGGRFYRRRVRGRGGGGRFLHGRIRGGRQRVRCENLLQRIQFQQGHTDIRIKR